jgi:hypothetical protein
MRFLGEEDLSWAAHGVTTGVELKLVEKMRFTKYCYEGPTERSALKFPYWLHIVYCAFPADWRFHAFYTEVSLLAAYCVL